MLPTHLTKYVHQYLTHSCVSMFASRPYKPDGLCVAITPIALAPTIDLNFSRGISSQMCVSWSRAVFRSDAHLTQTSSQPWIYGGCRGAPCTARCVCVCVNQLLVIRFTPALKFVLSDCEVMFTFEVPNDRVSGGFREFTFEVPSDRVSGLE